MKRRHYSTFKLIFEFEDNKGNKGKKVFYYYDDKNDDKYRFKEDEELGIFSWTFPYYWFLENRKM